MIHTFAPALTKKQKFFKKLLSKIAKGDFGEKRKKFKKYLKKYLEVKKKYLPLHSLLQKATSS